MRPWSVFWVRPGQTVPSGEQGEILALYSALVRLLGQTGSDRAEWRARGDSCSLLGRAEWKVGEALALYSAVPSGEQRGALALYSAVPSGERGGDPCSLLGRAEWRATGSPCSLLGRAEWRARGSPCSLLGRAEWRARGALALCSAVPSGKRGEPLLSARPCRVESEGSPCSLLGRAE